MHSPAVFRVTSLASGQFRPSAGETILKIWMWIDRYHTATQYNKALNPRMCFGWTVHHSDRYKAFIPRWISGVWTAQMHLSHIPKCTIQNRNVHISVLNCVLMDMGQVSAGICEVVLFDTCVWRAFPCTDQVNDLSEGQMNVDINWAVGVRRRPDVGAVVRQQKLN